MSGCRFPFIECSRKLSIGKRVFIKCRPILKSKLFSGFQGIVFLHDFCPIVRLFDNLKFDGRLGVFNAIEMNFTQEKTNFIIGMIIQPLNRCAVLFACVLHNPYNRIRFFTRSICDQFTKVIVIGIFKLIFNNYLSPRAHLGCHNIDAKISDSRFRFVHSYFHADCVAQN